MRTSTTRTQVFTFSLDPVVVAELREHCHAISERSLSRFVNQLLIETLNKAKEAKALSAGRRKKHNAK